MHQPLMKSFSRFITPLILVILLLSGGCSTRRSNLFTDNRDGSVYYYKNINGFHWMTCNLNYINESIFCKGAWVFSYDKDEYKDALIRLKKNNSGVLYNYSSAMKEVPEGWRLPTSNEWRSLIESSVLKHNVEWSSLNIKLDGRARSFGKFCIYSGTTFWTSDRVVKSDGTVKCIAVVIDYSDNGEVKATFQEEDPDYAFYVRCVKRNPRYEKNTQK